MTPKSWGITGQVEVMQHTIVVKRKKSEKTGFVHPLKVLKSEEEAVIEYAKGHAGIGYKKLTYQMFDEGIAAIRAMVR